MEKVSNLIKHGGKSLPKEEVIAYLILPSMSAKSMRNSKKREELYKNISKSILQLLKVMRILRKKRKSLMLR
jgi:hypothetical protein